jgi:tRNA-dihydrouridine synthase
VKHRAGWNHDHRNAPEFACAMVEAGAQMITVHGRTRTQGFSGKSDPDIIRMVRDAVPAHIPVVGNGDVIDVDGYRALREHTGCDAVMIGRGALGNPWLFAEVLGTRRTAPSEDEVLEEWAWVLDRAAEHLGPERAARYLRKFHPWYVERLGAGKGVGAALQQADTLAEQRAVIAGLRPLLAA